MIRRSPCEYYLKYLLSHPRGYDNVYVVQLCKKLGLDYLGNWYLDSLRDSLRPPTPFYPQDPAHARSMQFVSQHMLRGAYQNDDEMVAAYRVLRQERVRELVEVLVTSGADDQTVAYALRVRHSYTVTPQALARYRHYFWNIQLLGTTELRALLRMRADEALDGPPEVLKQHSALTKVAWRDPRVTAADLPQGDVAALIAQVEMGVMPPPDRLVDVLVRAQAACALRLSQEALAPSKGSAMRLAHYSTALKVVSELLENAVKPEDQLRTELQQIEMKTTSTVVPSIQALTGGDHTVELLPAPTGAEEVVTDDDAD